MSAFKVGQKVWWVNHDYCGSCVRACEAVVDEGEVKRINKSTLAIKGKIGITSVAIIDCCRSLSEAQQRKVDAMVDEILERIDEIKIFLEDECSPGMASMASAVARIKDAADELINLGDGDE